MNLYNQIDEVCALLKVISPTMSTDFVIKELQPIYEENKNLSDAAIIRKLIEYILSNQPFGAEISEAARELKRESSYATEEIFSAMDFSSVIKVAKSTLRKHEKEVMKDNFHE